MRIIKCLLGMSAGMAVGLLQDGAEIAPPQAQSAAILTGHVASAEAGPMEGVVVSARKDGATFTVSVVTGAEGRYSFPAARLEPGHYRLSIRAGGYELDSPNAVDVSAAHPVSGQRKLR